MAEGSTLMGNRIIQLLDALLFQLLLGQHRCPHFSLFPRSSLGHCRGKKLVPASASPRGCRPRGVQGQEKDLNAKSQQALRAACGQCFSIVSAHVERETNWRVRSH